MKTYILSPSQLVRGYRREVETQVERSVLAIDKWETTSDTYAYSSNVNNAIDYIKYNYSRTQNTWQDLHFKYRRYITTKDWYRFDMTFDTSGVHGTIQSVKLRCKLTAKNNNTPLGHRVFSVNSATHFVPVTQLGNYALGYPNTPYEYDVPLVSLSPTGWYCVGDSDAPYYSQNQQLTYDMSAFRLVIVTNYEDPEPPTPTPTFTSNYRTASVTLPAGTYTAFCAGGAQEMACLITTTADVYVNYYAKESREKITFTLTAECVVQISVHMDNVSKLMVVEGEDTTMSYIPYGDTVYSTFISGYQANDVVGYIPTTGVNGHYEYDELNSDGTNTPGSADNPGVWVRPFLDEQRNLIQTKQMNTFTADGIHKVFYLTENNCDVQKVEILLKTRCKNVDGEDVPTQDEIGTVDEGVSPNTGIRYYYKHIWTEKAKTDATYAWAATNASSSGDPYATKITFTNTPATHEENLVNIRVTFAPHEFTYIEDKDKGRIAKCSVVGTFGYFNNNRFYFTGNPDYKGMDWESGVDDPTYFPANGWTQVGSKETAIQGYLHYGEELAIIKEDNNIDATVYMRTAVTTEDEDVIFPVKQGAQGVGGLSKWCLKTLHDEPLFLAKEGVYAIQGTDASQERTIPSRSIFIDAKLRLEASNQCVAETFKDYYILVNPVTKHAFVADWRRSTEQLEWSLWDNIPASVMFATDEQLFFGTRDGKLCVFNFDFTDKKRYMDELVIDIDEDDPAQRLDGSNPFTGGKAIPCFYVTKRDHLGTYDYKKTMLADGGVITVRPHKWSSASVTVTTDKGEWFVDSIQTDSEEPSFVIPIRHRVKNFDSIETRVENDKPCEGLALLGIQYRYAITTNRR